MKESMYLSIFGLTVQITRESLSYTFTRTSCRDVAALNINSNLITRCSGN